MGSAKPFHNILHPQPLSITGLNWVVAMVGCRRMIAVARTIRAPQPTAPLADSKNHQIWSHPSVPWATHAPTANGTMTNRALPSMCRTTAPPDEVLFPRPAVVTNTRTPMPIGAIAANMNNHAFSQPSASNLMRTPTATEAMKPPRLCFFVPQPSISRLSVSCNSKRKSFRSRLE